MALAKVGLNDKYDLTKTRVYVTGTQAVMRLSLMQHALDRKNGLKTAGYISGYRGSPLGGLDIQLASLRDKFAEKDIVFQPGINEDLAATAIWGTQQAELRGEGKFDGVFAIWYGKGPGVDRSGDVFRHANHAGTSRNGGVLALMGDDHTCESSTSAHQSEFAFVDAMMPVLSPAGVQEILDYGLYGWALSRYAGVWVGLKCVKDNVEQTASIEAGLDRVNIVIPEEFEMPEGGLNIRLGDGALEKEARLHKYKRHAVLAFTRANKLDRLIMRGGSAPKIGVVTAGKSYLDVAEALDLLGIDEVKAANLGVRLYKVAVPWPLEPEGITRFAEGLDLIVVVEEKRSLIETQIKEQLYGVAGAPAIVGKFDEEGDSLFRPNGSLEPVEIAVALGKRILAVSDDAEVRARLDDLTGAVRHAANAESIVERVPYFCAGCPHNSSTIIPEGSRAYAGIGCHYMVQWMDRDTEGFTHMGGEGANWIGEAPFSKREHVFQNLGDGTYVHSGSLAIRAAVAAGTNMTFKLLYNDAVAMTGGQPLDGAPSVARMARQLVAEGVKRVVVVSDEPEKYGSTSGFPPGTWVQHRDNIQPVQEKLREIEGVTALIYDQTCAAEKRRRRKRGLYPDPPKRVVINEAVCEGCGDCGVQSNCVAIVPVETPLGRKRAIDQSACNKDFSCLKGFCPSFVTVHDGELKRGIEDQARGRDVAPDLSNVPEPVQTALDQPRSLLVTGVGGTGVVTVGALLGMAAHLENKGVGIIDMSGLAQKGGAVIVHIRIGKEPGDIKAIRASVAGADLVLGCDLVVAGSDKVLGTVRDGRTAIVANSHEIMTADFTRDRNVRIPGEDIRLALEARSGSGRSDFIDANRYATALMGDTIATNMFLLGFAFQRGHIPLSSEAIKEAIKINGVAVNMNQRAFAWGRMAAHDPNGVAKAIEPVVAAMPERSTSMTLDETIGHRVAFLTAYQGARLGRRYKTLVDKVRAAEAQSVPGSERLSMAVARNFAKLLAYKDEYEVARLYTDGAFAKQLESQFKPGYRLEFHLAPPLLAKKHPATGRPLKRGYGPGMLKWFGILARFKFLRGTPLDLFGYSAERRRERRMIKSYRQLVEDLVRDLSPENIEFAVELAGLPDAIRGYGYVKTGSMDVAAAEQARLLELFRAPPAKQREAA